MSIIELIDDVIETLSKVYQRLGKEPESLDRQIIDQLAEQLIEAVKLNRDVSLSSLSHKSQKYDYAAVHAVDVAILAITMLNRMGYKSVHSVAAASLTMNISYLSLLNQLPFSRPRYNVIQKQSYQQHPQLAYDMLIKAGVTDKTWLDTVLNHHELLNGKGFPTGKVKRDIQPMSRLIACCDYYCTELKPKKYQNGQAPSIILQQLFHQNSDQYDTKLAPLFYASLGIIAPGTRIMLKDERQAICLKEKKQDIKTLYQLKVIDNKTLEKSAREISIAQISRQLEIDFKQNYSLYELYDLPKPQPKAVIYQRIYGRSPGKMELVKSRRIIQAADLPVMPDVIQEVELELHKKSPDLKLISELISSDVALSALLIKTVSRLTLSSDPITSINHALTILGLDKLNGLLKTALLSLSFKDIDEKLINYWEDAQTTAWAAARIAEEIADIEPEEAYMAGLFQNAGSIILSMKFKDYFDKTFEKSIAEPFSFLTYEQSLYGTDRGLIAYMICHEWNLPEEVKLAVYFRYIKDYQLIENSRIRTLTAVISLASYLTDAINKLIIKNTEEQEQLVALTLKELMIDAEEVERMKNEIMLEMKN